MRTGRLLGLLGLCLFAISIARPVAAQLPAGWTARDIGNPHPVGKTVVEGTGADAVWTVTGTGSDIWNATDQFQLAYTTLNGDGGITARLLGQSGGNGDGWAKTGTMLRESTAASSRCAYMPYTNGNKFQASWRLTSNTTPTDAGLARVGRTLDGGPIWIRTQRRGQQYEQLLSDDGKEWALIGSQKIAIPANKAILAGLCASMHGGDTPVVATFDNVSVSSDLVTPTPPGPETIQATPGDGSVVLTYSAASGAAGYNIYRREASEPVAARVRINPQTTLNTWYTDSGEGGRGLPNGAHFVYSVRAVFKDRTGQAREGLASREVLALPQTPILPGYLFYYWSTTHPATVSLDGRWLSFTVTGDDIWTAPDGGAFLGMPATGDYSLSLRVVEKPGADPPYSSGNVKAGVMIREGIGPSERYAFLFTTSGRGVLFEGARKARSDSSGQFSQAGTGNDDTLYPVWLKLTRQGSQVTAFQSSDGVNYLPVGDPQYFSRLQAATFAGIAMSSGSGTGTGSARFDAATLQVQ